MKTVQTRKKMNRSKSAKPLVSVIMPVFNSARFLPEAIESILNQTYQNFEFIIIDDASTDNSLSIIKRYQKQYAHKIKVIELSHNLNCGGDACVNEGLKIAKGEYIARMDADDISYPTRLEKQVAYLEEYPRTFLLGSNADVIDKNSKIIGEKLEPTTHEEIYRSYLTFHPLIHPTCMIRRINAGKRFSYAIHYSANNDYYTFFSLLCQGKRFANLPDKLIQYRIHDKNDTFFKMKEKYFNTLKIRLSMVFLYGYQPKLLDILTSIIQTILIVTLPEKILKQIYFIVKGISKPRFSGFKIPALSRS